MAIKNANCCEIPATLPHPLKNHFSLLSSAFQEEFLLIVYDPSSTFLSYFLAWPYILYIQMTLMGFDWFSLLGAAEIVQLLRKGESQPAAAGQAGNEHFECHAGNSKPGKECGL